MFRSPGEGHGREFRGCCECENDVPRVGDESADEREDGDVGDR